MKMGRCFYEDGWFVGSVGCSDDVPVGNGCFVLGCDWLMFFVDLGVAEPSWQARPFLVRLIG